MSHAPYGLGALREYRRLKAEAPGVSRAHAPVTLADIPPDAPIEDGIALGVWNGEAFVSWQKWMTSLPIEALRQEPVSVSTEAPPASAPVSRPPREKPPISGSLFDVEVTDGRAR